MKRIVICCDGTWNWPDKTEEGVPCPTNVVRLAEAISPTAQNRVDQLTYYDPGVGTGGWIGRRLFDGATGRGLSANIVEAYRYLILNYEPGDELFFFGFSRGAFTVRSLAGLIRNSGILRRNEADLIKRAFRLYKGRSEATHPREKEATMFRKSFSVSDIVPIKFIGVWDTVGSLGNPLLINTVFGRLSPSITRNQFHDTDLSSTVSYAYQALAIDEKRRNFRPALWHMQSHSVNQTLEQVWFIGVHSNVGGGYAKTGLSGIALNWLTGKAKTCGLEMEDIEMEEDLLEMPEKSWKGFYRLVPRYYRTIGIGWDGQESVHESALSRFSRDPNYRPKNLKAYLDAKVHQVDLADLSA